jgi:ribosome-binding factor A
MDAPRARKLADRIAQIVAEMLERRIKDPRLGFVTVTGARLTNDLREATVFYTVYGPDEERQATAAALDSATGVIRTEVGRQTGLRHTPSLAFEADTVPETARLVEELIDRAREADAALARARQGAVPAGDPDPYRDRGGLAGTGDGATDRAADGAAEGAAEGAADGADDTGTGYAAP